MTEYFKWDNILRWFLMFLLFCKGWPTGLLAVACQQVQTGLRMAISNSQRIRVCTDTLQKRCFFGFFLAYCSKKVYLCIMLSLCSIIIHFKISSL